MHQVSEATGDFAAGMQQLAVSSGKLDELTKGMQQLVGQFRI